VRYRGLCFIAPADLQLALVRPERRPNWEYCPSAHLHSLDDVKALWTGALNQAA